MASSQLKLFDAEIIQYFVFYLKNPNDTQLCNKTNYFFLMP